MPLGVGERGEQGPPPVRRDRVCAGDALDGRQRDALRFQRRDRFVLGPQQRVHAEARSRGFFERGEDGLEAVGGDDLFEPGDERVGERHGRSGE